MSIPININLIHFSHLIFDCTFNEMGTNRSGFTRYHTANSRESVDGKMISVSH